jgi:hypothetical protein
VHQAAPDPSNLFRQVKSMTDHFQYPFAAFSVPFEHFLNHP